MKLRRSTVSKLDPLGPTTKGSYARIAFTGDEALELEKDVSGTDSNCKTIVTNSPSHVLFQFGSMMGVVIVKDPSLLPNITHLVFADSHPNKARTFKALMAYSVTDNIVRREWVFACKKAGSIVPAEPYRVSLPNDIHNWFDINQTISNGNIARESGGLFNQLNFYIHPETLTQGKTLDLSEVKALIKAGGGNVVRMSHMQRSSNNHVNSVIIVGDDVTLKPSFAYATKCGYVCTYHQFVRAIAHQSLGEIKSKRLANASEEDGKCVYH